MMEYLSATLCVWSQPGLGLAGQAKPCQSSCPPHQAWTEIGSHVSIWLGLERTGRAVLCLALIPHPAVFVPAAQLHLAQPRDVGHLGAGSVGGRDLRPGPGMARAGPPPWPPPALTWPTTRAASLLLRWSPTRAASSLLSACTWSGRPSTRLARSGCPATHWLGSACFPVSSRGLPGRCAAAAVSICTASLASRAGSTASMAGEKLSASFPALHRVFNTIGAAPELGCSNLYEMCADHPSPPFPHPSVLLAPPTSTLPTPPHLSSLLRGNEVEFGSGGGAVSGGVVFEPLGSSGGGTNKAVSATRQFYQPEGGLCGKADYVAGTTESASNLTYCNTTDAKPQKDSNSANIRF